MRAREPEAHQAGDGEHDGVVFAAVELREPRLDVAAQQAYLEPRIALADLRRAAQARGAERWRPPASPLSEP